MSVSNTTGSDATMEQEDEDDDLMREIYEAMEAQCGLSGGPSPSTRRPTPSSRPSWCLADALSRRDEGTHAASSEMWSGAHNGVRPLVQVCDVEGSLTHEAVLHLSQAERWSSQASHVSPASHRTSPHYLAHNREERLGRARRSLDLGLGLSLDLDDVAHREEHQHTGERSGTRAPSAGTGTNGDGEVCAGGGADVPYAADILMAREDGDLMAREDGDAMAREDGDVMAREDGDQMARGRR